MPKVTWKVIKGNGPYAYVQKTERDGDITRSVHVAYLGAYGTKGLVPTEAYILPQKLQAKIGRAVVSIPAPDGDLLKDLKPAALARFQNAGNLNVLFDKDPDELIDDKVIMAGKAIEAGDLKLGLGISQELEKAGYPSDASDIAEEYQDAVKGLHQKITKAIDDKKLDEAKQVVDLFKKAGLQGTASSYANDIAVLENEQADPPTPGPTHPKVKILLPGDGYHLSPGQMTALVKDLPTDPELPTLTQLKTGAYDKLKPTDLVKLGKAYVETKDKASAEFIRDWLLGNGNTWTGQQVAKAIKKAKLPDQPPAKSEDVPGETSIEGMTGPQVYEHGVGLVASGDVVGAEQVLADIDKEHGDSPPAAYSFAKEKIENAIHTAQENLNAYGKSEDDAIPQWKKISGPKGSTPGGVYENEDGEKYYLKCPSTPNHGRNELLAQDLYRLAGLQVLESKGTVLNGESCVASKWIESLKGSGQNPKDLEGTLEGFVADAWLANWDSVGVGTSKYDNILDDGTGKAVRVDTGGALLYRGTGSAKGSKFGNKVTELEGLRNPTLNPVAATVYGDMTMDQIEKSASKVTSITNNAIINAVVARFDDDKVADGLAAKLITRRDYIRDWVKEQSKASAASSTPEPTPVNEEAVKNAIQFGIKYAGDGLIGHAKAVAGEVEKLGGDASAIHDAIQKQQSGNEEYGALAQANEFDVFSQPWKETKKWAVELAEQGEVEAAEVVFSKMKIYAKKKFVTKKLLDPVVNAIEKAKEKQDADQQASAESIQEGIPDSGHAAVQNNDTKTSVGGPTNQEMAEQKEKIASGKKRWAEDLEQIEGQKGSNYGGLYKDKVTDTLHYVKWPGADRARMEALATNLYAQAGVYVPTVRVIDFPPTDKAKDSTAVMSDWVADPKKMTAAQMKAHQNVREGFLVDAWLANWDVVGLSADNIVKSGDAAIRIDAGGALVYRAQGGAKAFPVDVPEFHTMRDPSKNPQAAPVFADLTTDELHAGIGKLESISDADIDAAITVSQFPDDAPGMVTDKNGGIANYAGWLANRLGDRRDSLIQQAKAEIMEKQGTSAKETPTAEPDVKPTAGVLAEAKKQATQAGVPYMFLNDHKNTYAHVVHGGSLENETMAGKVQTLAKSLASKGYWQQANFLVVALEQAGKKVSPAVKNAVVKFQTKTSAPMTTPATGDAAHDLADTYEQAKADAQAAGKPYMFLNAHKIAYNVAMGGGLGNSLVTNKLISDAQALAKSLANKDYPIQANFVALALEHAGHEVPAVTKQAIAKATSKIDAVPQEKPDTTPVTTGIPLKSETISQIIDEVNKDGFYSANANEYQKSTRIKIMEDAAAQEGITKTAVSATRAAYSSWKGSATTAKAQTLRWAISELDGKGQQELDATQKFLNSKLGSGFSQSKFDELVSSTKTSNGKNILRGADLSRKVNAVIHQQKHGGEPTIAVYRGFPKDQLKQWGIPSSISVGDEIAFERLPALSWSLNPNCGFVGTMKVKAIIPVSAIVVSDRVNNNGKYPHEDEAVFRAENLDTEVISKSIKDW